jgi:hypothetical protein
MRKYIFLIILIFIFLFSMNSYAWNVDHKKNISYKENLNFKLSKNLNYKDTNLWLYDKRANTKIQITNSLYQHNYDLYNNGNVIYVTKEKGITILKFFNYKNKTVKLLKTPVEYYEYEPRFINENKICYIITDRDPYATSPSLLYLNDINKNIYQQLTYNFTLWNRIIYKNNYIIFEQNGSIANTGVYLIDANSLRIIKISDIMPGNTDMIILKDNILKLNGVNDNEEIIDLDKVISEEFK